MWRPGVSTVQLHMGQVINFWQGFSAVEKQVVSSTPHPYTASQYRGYGQAVAGIPHNPSKGTTLVVCVSLVSFTCQSLLACVLLGQEALIPWQTLIPWYHWERRASPPAGSHAEPREGSIVLPQPCQLSWSYPNFLTFRVSQSSQSRNDKTKWASQLLYFLIV